MKRRLIMVTAATAAIMVAAPLAAVAESLDPFLERSVSAEFSGQQVVSCETPSGQRTVAVEIAQVDGVTTARNAVGGEAEVQLAGGSFSVTNEDGIAGTSAALSTAIPTGMYSVSQVKNVQVVGRDAQRVTVVDRGAKVRASMTFDVETGALLSARIRNADQSIYCDVRMVEFNPVDGGTDHVKLAAAATSTLDPVEAPDDPRIPETVAGFARLETYDWSRGGVIAYYSDGLFSFALLATDRPVVLDDAGAESVQLDGGEYVRWFGAGQVIYVWETRGGGVTMYGDLPLDLQSDVLDGLPDPQRQGVLSRWWRQLFG